MQKSIDFGPVADLYDTYVRWEADFPYFRRLCEGTKADVLELMCGTGRLSLHLLETGVRLWCVDYSPEMLTELRRKLRERGLAAEIREMDVREVDLGRLFELILLPFHSLAEIVAEADRAQALARIRKHLAPGGRFVVTLHNPAVQVPRLDGVRRLLCENPIPGRDARLRVWSTQRHRAQESLGEGLQEYEILGADGAPLERRALHVRFAIIDRLSFESAAAAAGFAVLHLWGDYEGGVFAARRSPFMVWELGPA